MFHLRTTQFFLLIFLSSIGTGWTYEISLGAALREAQIRNPSIQASGSQVREAEYQVWDARSSLLPNLAVMAEYSKHEEPVLVSPMSEPPTPASPLPFDDEIYTGVLRLEIPILDLPSLAGVQGARSQVAVRRAQSAELEQAVHARVTEIFVQARRLEDSGELLDSYIRAREQRLREVRLLESEGRVSPAAVAVVEASLDRAWSDRLEIQSRQDELSVRLGEILGRDRPVRPSPETLISPNLAENESPAGPRLQIAEAQRSGAEAARRAALSSFAPSVTGFAAQTARSGSELEFVTNWSAGVTVTVPIVTGGARVSRLQAAEQGVQAASYSYAAAELNAGAELLIARSRWESTGHRREVLARAASHQERSVSAMEDLFREGRASLSDLLTEEATLLELRMQERTVLYEQLRAFVAYHQAAGSLSLELLQSLIQE